VIVARGAGISQAGGNRTPVRLRLMAMCRGHGNWGALVGSLSPLKRTPSVGQNGAVAAVPVGLWSVQSTAIERIPGGVSWVGGSDGVNMTRLRPAEWCIGSSVSVSPAMATVTA